MASAWIPPSALQGAQAARIEAAHAEGIDWGVFLALIGRHGLVVSPEPLRGTLGGRLPGQVSEQLAARKAAACRAALRHAAELVRIERAFRAEGIEMLPMKGVLLSQQLYGDPAMRACRDLDLLVQPDRLWEAGEILVTQGYRCIYPDFGMTPRRRQWVLRYGSHFVYHRGDSGQLVELHWHLTQWRAEHVAELWGHCRSLPLMGSTFQALRDEALILFLCDHGAKHEWRRAKWLVDVAAFLAQDRDPFWDQILALADRYGVSRPLAEAGMLTHWLFDVPLPPPLRESIGCASAFRPAVRSVRALLLSDRDALALPGRLRGAVVQFWRKPGWSRRESLRSSLLSTDEFRECPLPDGLFWLYFPLRPFLWLYHHYLVRVFHARPEPFRSR